MSPPDEPLIQPDIIVPSDTESVETTSSDIYSSIA